MNDKLDVTDEQKPSVFFLFFPIFSTFIFEVHKYVFYDLCWGHQMSLDIDKDLELKETKKSKLVFINIFF
jgi:hypothetical protein